MNFVNVFWILLTDSLLKNSIVLAHGVVTDCKVTQSLRKSLQILGELLATLKWRENKLNALVSSQELQQPSFLYTTDGTVSFAEGEDVEIWCIVHGKPSPKIEWLKESGKMGLKRVKFANQGTALRIKNVGMSDAGTYVCIASNDIGAPVSQYFRLQVDSKIKNEGLSGLFAATEAGLFSIDLQTLKASGLTRENTFAVAVNPKLKKVYWSEVLRNSRIMRSNYDGSAKKIIVPPTGDSIFMLAIDEASGNIYFAKLNSNEIRVCNAKGKNCASAISNSLYVTGPVGMVLDSVNGVMYWGKRWWQDNYLMRTYLNDSRRITKLSTEFHNLHGMTFDRHSTDVIYWIEKSRNAIGIIDVNGENKRTLVQLEGNPQPWGIQVYGGKIYFSTSNGRNIQSVDKRSGKQLTTIFSSSGEVRHLALFSESNENNHY